MTAPTEAAGVGMSVEAAFKVLDSEIASLPVMAAMAVDTCDATEAVRRLTAAKATLQARLLAADELREAAYMVIPNIENSGATALLERALAAYDKAALALRPSGDGVG